MTMSKNFRRRQRSGVFGDPSYRWLCETFPRECYSWLLVVDIITEFCQAKFKFWRSWPRRILKSVLGVTWRVFIDIWNNLSGLADCIRQIPADKQKKNCYKMFKIALVTTLFERVGSVVYRDIAQEKKCRFPLSSSMYPKDLPKVEIQRLFHMLHLHESQKLFCCPLTKPSWYFSGSQARQMLWVSFEDPT